MKSENSLLNRSAISISFRNVAGVAGLSLAALSLSGLTACASGGDDTGEPAAAPAPAVASCDVVDECGAGDPRPGRRSESEAFYDPVNQRMIAFGGVTLVPEGCGFISAQASDYPAETWSFYDKCGIWKQITGAQPPPRSRMMIAYDPAGERGLMFGGRFRQTPSGSYQLFNDLWEFDVNTDNWTELVTQGIAPAPRVNAGFVVDGTGTYAYLFGGNTAPSGANYNPQNDLWQLDLSTMTWTELSPTGTAPTARLFVAALFDPGRDRMVMTFGADASAFLQASGFNDVWSYNVGGNTWEQLNPGGAGAPAGRFWGEWVYDVSQDRYLAFGGHDVTNLGNTNDLWAFDPDANTWSDLRIGDTYNKPALGTCDFPPDFTVVDMEAPERRNAHMMVYATGGGCDSVLIAMGKTDCGAADDAWRWKIADGAWQELMSANQGEMCLRADRGFDCQGMCQ